MEPEKIKLKTSDDYEIAGDLYAVAASDIALPSQGGRAEKNSPAIVLSHMLPAAKESWKDFAKKLNNAGFHCLAIDLRGHGESQDGPIGSREYSDQQHQSSIKDVEAAAGFFANMGISMDKIIVAGASIGANLSLQFQSEHPEVKASVLLSPGLNYKGIEMERMAKNLGEEQSVFFVAGGENDEYSAETVFKLHNLAKTKNKQIKIFKSAGHGTDMFKEEPNLMDEIAEWLKSIYLKPQT